MKKKHNVWMLLGSVLFAEGLGFLSSMLSGDIRGKYEMMVKPPLSPPGQLFGIVWVILYALMGVAAYLVLRADSPRQKKTFALVLYVAQLLVNGAWSIVFFRSQLLWVALAVIVVLDILVILCIERFSRISRLAAGLMIPYLVWILFATYLNVGFALLN